MKGLAGHREKSPSYSGCSGDKSDEIRFTSLQFILWFQSAQCVGVGEDVQCTISHVIIAFSAT